MVSCNDPRSYLPRPPPKTSFKEALVGATSRYLVGCLATPHLSRGDIKNGVANVRIDRKNAIAASQSIGMATALAISVGHKFNQ